MCVNDSPCICNLHTNTLPRLSFFFFCHTNRIINRLFSFFLHLHTHTHTHTYIHTYTKAAASLRRRPAFPRLPYIYTLYYICFFFLFFLNFFFIIVK